jgi:hypothetical protein
MSGGSYQYAYYQIEELAAYIRPTSALRKAFKAHLVKIAKACHDIEWVDSGDYGPGDEDDAIRACLGEATDALVLAEVLAEAKKIHSDLGDAISLPNSGGEGRREKGVSDAN